MVVTLFLSLVLIVSLIVMLLSAVILVQDKRLFTTAPKDIRAAAKEHAERFPGARALGWVLIVLSVAAMLGAFVYGAYDGVKNGFTFLQFFLRFIIMLYLWKAFDIICLDWLLLTKTHFFQHFYPETKGCAGYSQFGFNRKGQLIRIAVFPIISLLIAWICTLL
ncbi:MAG: hypothetical protein IJM18_01815 [Clostridia bacterium]|nr:hypothetical protein [Clostridia bacterium]